MSKYDIEEQVGTFLKENNDVEAYQLILPNSQPVMLLVHGAGNGHYPSIGTLVAHLTRDNYAYWNRKRLPRKSATAHSEK